LRFPAEFCLGFCGVADEEFDFRWAFVAGIVFDMFLPVQISVGEGEFDEFFDGVGFVGGENIIAAFGLLEHSPHAFDVFWGVTPVALGFHVAEVEFFLASLFDGGDGASDFSGDKGFPAARTFVVEEDAIASVDAVAFTVVDRGPVSVDFGDGVRGAWPERGGLCLGDFLDLAEHFAGTGLIKASGNAGFAKGFEEADGSEGGDISSVFWDIETDADMALSAEMVDFVGPSAIDEAGKVEGVGKVAVVEMEADTVDVGIRVKVIDS